MEMSPLADAKASNVNSQTFKTANDSTEARYVSVDGVKINKNPDLAINPKAQNRIGATKIVKTAIKLIINNKSKAVAVVEKVGGKKRLMLLIKHTLL
ncbi:hypothetical protein [Staphylococcus pseudintermedius]|uniref:hypothetical protein n=1 Tax=Staphylococcus pseudintermedius TaxID=283734 RepID=UPI0028FD04B6|nr:hypothetical protein [Staphylococcus pseudintermedius]MDU0383318.1 hypothetical protein [Staphylococcus pseudintermedius]